MKILLISPCQDITRKTPGPLQIPQVSLQLLAGMTDEKHEIQIVEEEFKDVDLSLEPDLVGLSLMTANAPRGYEIAGHFRKKGAKVILGGIHPTILPEEGQEHADSVLVGEAEQMWPQMVADAEAGRLQEIYRAPGPADLSDVPYPRREIGKVKRFFDVVPVMTTRGCPYNCEFCSVTDVYGKKIRNFPVEWVVEDIKRANGKYHLILDDNVVGRPAFAEELFKALKPLNITWVGQASMSFANREDLMRQAYESGCRGLFFGMETVSESSMKRMKKSFRDLQDVADAIKRIQKVGIVFHASVVFGFDTDEPDIFQETVDFLMKCRVFSVTFNILTPYPGTRVYTRLKEQGRLFSEDWQNYDHTTVVFQPTNMSPIELAEGHLKARRGFFRLGAILKRLPHNRKHPFLYSAMNLAFRSAARRARVPIAPGGEGLGSWTPPAETPASKTPAAQAPG